MSVFDDKCFYNGILGDESSHKRAFKKAKK